MHDHPAARQLVRVPARAATDIEHAVPRLEAECLDDEVDLLRRSLGERVPQVRRPEVFSDGFEPVTHSTNSATTGSAAVTGADEER